MKRYRLRESMNGIAEPPRKTWFWELEAGVIEADRCIQCGTCVAACPSNSIGINEDTNLPELVKMCTGCSLCWDFCPRGGLRYETTWPPSTPSDAPEAQPVELVTKPDPADTYFKLTGAAPGKGLGRVEATYAARAAKRTDGVQDGGVVTSLLVALLDSGEIDGALVAKPSSDPDEPWKAVPTVVTSAAEIKAAAGSFYNQSMALAALDLTGKGLPANPRLAVVGTPCEVAGLRAMQSRRWPTGSHRVDAVFLTIALLCTKSFSYEGLMLDELKRRRGIDLDRVSKVDVTRGRLIVEYIDGATAVDEPIKAFHGAALKGCDECADFLGRAADISVGSVGSNDGWTTVLVRTERGRQSFEAARRSLDVRDLDDASALIRLDELDQKIARRAMARDLDPMGETFMTYDDHVANYAGTSRQPVVIRR